ncbi:WD40 repeat domain-containing protein [Alkalihalobacillus oceani]|uniref:WD40 repeat domain-containing protein n=1 Tax=Halalkalibacter oceani TaxID=1653776 RepID=A0A9X2DP37_9BACI|nr:WD40 repeat domain-containing protein [Halalkalibacter oceani]MCM3713838.1 WD40 repeat domain-containing protein [Halalkalibacter oceani]
MKQRHLIVLFFLVIMASGCYGGRSETIIIPDLEEKDAEESHSQLFQVKTIYSLPSLTQLFGWSFSDSVVGVFREDESSESLQNDLYSLSAPYEKPELLKEIDENTFNLAMSPDGKKMVGLTVDSVRASLNLFSLTNGNKTEIRDFELNNRGYFQDVAWSNNSRYVSYLMIGGKDRNHATIGIYDTASGTHRKYSLDGVEYESLTGVTISDNGKGLLITSWPHARQEFTIFMGKITESGITIQYKNQIGGGKPVWLTNDQFMFIGQGETLYEYDHRNGELSSLLEKVATFKLSNDRKKIAYSLYDNDTIYAGRLQGKNIIYQEPVYQGIIPIDMYWSPTSNNLLIYGRKQTSSIQGPSSAAPIIHSSDQAYIVEF